MLATGRGSTLSRELYAAPGTLTAIGVLGYAGSASLASLALGLLPAGVTALMSNSSPLIVVMAGALVFHQRVGRPEVAGTLVGFSGVALLSAGDIQATGVLGSTVLGSGLALDSAACWAAYTAIARRLVGADPLVTTALTSGIGAAVVGVVALPSHDWSRLANGVCASHRGHHVGWGDRHRLHVRGLEVYAPTLTGDRGSAVRLSDSALRAVHLALLARRATDRADAGWIGDFFSDTGRGDDALARYVVEMADLEQLTPPGGVIPGQANGTLGKPGRRQQRLVHRLQRRGLSSRTASRTVAARTGRTRS